MSHRASCNTGAQKRRGCWDDLIRGAHLPRGERWFRLLVPMRFFAAGPLFSVRNGIILLLARDINIEGDRYLRNGLNER